MFSNSIRNKELEDEENLKYFVKIILKNKKRFLMHYNKEIEGDIMKFEIYNHFRKIKLIYYNNFEKEEKTKNNIRTQ